MKIIKNHLEKDEQWAELALSDTKMYFKLQLLKYGTDTRINIQMKGV